MTAAVSSWCRAGGHGTCAIHGDDCGCSCHGDLLRTAERFVAAERFVDGPRRKEDVECCRAARDADGRFLPGYCSPDCVRRPKPKRAKV